MSNSACKHISRIGGTKLIRDYLSQSNDLRPFIADFPSYEVMIEHARKQKFDTAKRVRLHDAIEQQYLQSGMTVPAKWEQIKEANVYTVTTGHQLNLFGGPKYFIYKIISVLKTVQELNNLQQNFKFLPVFWMASEDHDFEEINVVNLFGESIRAKETATGPVGRIPSTHFKATFEELKKVLGTSKEANELIALFQKAFKQKKWSDFTRFWVNELFDGEVIIVDGDDPKLKELFVPVIQQEMEEQVTDRIVADTNEKLEVLGYHKQVGHRAINLFYIEDGIRERIGLLNGRHKVHNLSRCLTLTDVLKHPESVSPNALLRPVYQETILPNVAYIGGPGELAYWFQLKALFDELSVPFPLLVLRDSFLFVKENDEVLLDKLGMTLEDLPLREDDLQKAYISKNKLQDVSFDKESAQLHEIMDELNKKVAGMHRDYRPMIEAERSRVEKFMNKLELRAMRDAKFKEEVNLRKLMELRNKYFPNGGVAERSSSFMEEYLLLGKANYLEKLMNSSDVEDHRIKVITVNK